MDGTTWGVGVFNNYAPTFAGGQVGANGGTETSSATKYISPLKRLALGKNDVFEYDYHLILGTLDEIRAFAYAQMGPEYWRFENGASTEGWSANAQLTNVAVNDGKLEATVTGGDPMLTRDDVAIAAPLNRYFHLRIRNQTPGSFAQLFWANELGGIAEARSAIFNISANDAEYQDYVVDLGALPAWEGTVTTLRLDPVSAAPTGTFSIEGMAITNSVDSPFAEEDTAVGPGWFTLQ